MVADQRVHIHIHTHTISTRVNLTVALLRVALLMSTEDEVDDALAQQGTGDLRDIITFGLDKVFAANIPELRDEDVEQLLNPPAQPSPDARSTIPLTTSMQDIPGTAAGSKAEARDVVDMVVDGESDLKVPDTDAALATQYVASM